jgi:hypothetical protein
MVNNFCFVDTDAWNKWIKRSDATKNVCKASLPAGNVQ